MFDAPADALVLAELDIVIDAAPDALKRAVSESEADRGALNDGLVHDE